MIGASGAAPRPRLAFAPRIALRASAAPLTAPASHSSHGLPSACGVTTISVVRASTTRL